MMNQKINFLLLFVMLFLTGCNHENRSTLKIAASSVPHAEILEFIKPELKEEQIDLEILIVDDYNMPNRALADKEVDANFFQHLPYMEAQMHDFGYDFIPLVSVHLEPLGLYSKKISSLHELKEGDLIAIPSDPSNESRALALLEQANVIQLDRKRHQVNVFNIKDNPLKLKFVEMDSSLLSRSLDDVDAAVINTNFALLAGLFPKKDALIVENEQSRFVNVVVIRRGDENKPEMVALKNALTSDKTRQFILENYRDALAPSF